MVLEFFVHSSPVRETVRMQRVSRKFRDRLPRILLQSRQVLSQGGWPFYHYPVPLAAAVVYHELSEPARFDQRIHLGIETALSKIRLDLDSASSDETRNWKLRLCEAFVRHYSMHRILWPLRMGNRCNLTDALWDPDEPSHALAAAASLGDIAALRRMLARGVDLAKRSSLFGSPLVAAAAANETEALKLLLEVSLEPTELKPGYHPCLCQAAFYASADAVRYLLSKPFDRLQNDRSVWQKTATSFLSIVPGHLRLSGPDRRQPSVIRFMEAFECACFGGDIEICEMLFNKLDKSHRKAGLDQGLTRACQMGHLHMAQYLIGQGASIDTEGKRENHLTWAIQVFAPKLVRLLLESGKVNVNCEEIPLFGCALQLATRHHDTSILRMLLDHGADKTGRAAGVRAPDTVLSIAASEGKYRAVKVLVERGADLEMDGNALLALCGAARAGHEEVVRYLIEEVGVDVNGIHRIGEATQTPLGAALSGDKGVKTAQILRRHGATLFIWTLPSCAALA